MSFKEEYSNTPPGPQREQLVYKAIISEGKPTDMWPITVNGPEGTKITYNITRDFLKKDGIWLPMTGTTAQKIADYFHMYLPTNTIADQVWKAAKAKLNISPLSGTGYQGKDRFYNPKEVVSNRISATDASVYFSEQIAKAHEANPKTKNELIDIGGGAKWLTVPPANGSLGLRGIRGEDGTPVQGGYGTAHQNYEDHTEYGTLVRLVDDNVSVEYPDGKKETMTMDNFIKSPLRSAMYAEGQDIRSGGLSKYNLNRDKAQLAKIDKEVVQPDQGNQMAKNEQIDNFLKELSQQFAAENKINKLLHKYANALKQIVYSDSIGKDPVIKNLSQSSVPGTLPDGFEKMPINENKMEIGQAASKILDSYGLGEQVPFTIAGQLYLGRVEPHFHPAPPAGTPDSEKNKYPKPWGWHKGVTVFKGKENISEEDIRPSGSQARIKLLQRVQDGPASLNTEEQVDEFLNSLIKQF